MRKSRLTTLALGSVMFAATAAYGNTGIFGAGVDISSIISGASTFNLYEMTLFGDSRYTPYNGGPSTGVTLGTLPALVSTYNGTSGSTWATGGSGQPAVGPSLGTFVQGVDTLTLNGGEILTYKNSGDNVSGTQIFYRIDGGAFNQINLAFNFDNVNGNNGDQRWYTDGAGANLLTGLSTGIHTLSVYFRDNSSINGNDYYSNLGNNFNAIFTISPAPEPSTMALCGISGVAMWYWMRRRR